MVSSKDDAVDGVDWYCIYDLIASRYSYTIEEFSKLTFKQINHLTKAISKSILEERKYQAALHGKEIKDNFDFDEFELTDKQQEVFDKRAKKRMEQWPEIKT